MKSFASYTNYLLYPGVFLRFKTKLDKKKTFFFWPLRMDANGMIDHQNMCNY